jgi:thiamine-monophosphate kinase
MRVSEIGEFGLIRLLTREIGVDFEGRGATPRPGLEVDTGDDAVVTAASGAPIVWTTDTMVDGVHFLPGRTSWRDTGWKALAVNVSDIAAMGATPEYALVTLCLPDSFCVEDALELYRGLVECSKAFGVTVAGGDVVRSPIFTVTVALCGRASADAEGRPLVLRRAAAKPGDAVAVTGTVGDAAGGVRLLTAGGERAADAAALLRAQERPLPRVDAGLAAVAAGIRCGMDVSDGLVQDLGHIAVSSGVAISLDAASVPLSPSLRRVFPEDALDLALTGGED